MMCRTLPSYGKRRLFRAYVGREAESGASGMPSLIRFLTVVGIIAGLGLAGMWALANLVEPQSREMTSTIPQDRLGK